MTETTRKAINLEALHYYLSYRHVPTPLSLVPRRVREEAIDLSWVKFSPVHDMTEDQIVDKMDEILTQRTKLLLEQYGRHLCFFLSGGVDSGVVTAIAAKLSKTPLQTHALLYAGEDETPGKRTDKEYARRLSEQYGTNHHEHTIGFRDFPVVMPTIIKQFGEPFSGYVSVYFLARFAKQYAGFAMTGDWADELFGSYKVHRLAAEHPRTALWDLMYSDAVWSDAEKRNLYSVSVRDETAGYDTRRHLQKYFESLTAPDPVNKMLEAGLRSFFPDHVYLSVVKMSQAHKVKIITPYASQEFVQFAVRIPGSMKNRDGETKYILKKLAERYLPRDIVYRKKEGFVTPTMPLVLSLEKYVHNQLNPEKLRKHGLFNIDYVQTLLDEFYASGGTEKLSYKIWNLVCFQVWYELYLSDSV